MNRPALLLAVTLLLPSAPARAEADRSSDIRYCLELKSNEEIAKCAGEIAPGGKGKPFSRNEVERMLEKERTSAPVRPDEASSGPATDQSAKDSLPEKTENTDK